MEEKNIKNAKSDWLTGLWILIFIWSVIFILSIRAGYVGDDGTRFGLMLLKLPFWFISLIIGFIATSKVEKLKKKSSDLKLNISFLSVNILALAVGFFPIIAFLLSLVLNHWFPPQPFSGL